MKRSTIILALGLAACSGAMAEAADWNNGARGIKDHGGMAGVPVPAPVPIMESFSWYVRADLGVGWLGGAGVSERGLQFGVNNGLAISTTESSWWQPDTDIVINGSLGVGYYFSPRIRGDLTVDARTPMEILGNGSYTFPEATGNPRALTGNTVSGTLSELVRVRDTTMLANAYFDLKDRGAFTPYVGVGGGFAVRTIDRNTTWTETTTDALGATTLQQTVTAKGKDHVLAPALSATAGAAIALSHGRVLDFNYRYTYIGEASSGTMVNGMRSVATIGDTHEHALRAGLRWNIW